MPRVRSAVYGAAGCGGCELSLFESVEGSTALLDVIEVVYWPLLCDARLEDLAGQPDGSIDLGLLCGAARTKLDLQVASLLAAKCRRLVAAGSCAAWGGVAALADLPPAYSRQAPAGLPLLLPELEPVTNIVRADIILPGCPPEPEQLGKSLAGLVKGHGSEDRTDQEEPAVCNACPRPRGKGGPGRWYRPQEVEDTGACFLSLGVVCSGPATRGGCGARCPTAGLPCRGCYGPPPGTRDQGAKLIGALAALEGGEFGQSSPFVDAAGTLYRYTLAAAFAGERER